jgi:NADH:ubiquinone oxidoreductase subunit 2 (subunit N)
MAILPAAILAALGVATLIAARISRSDLVCAVLCAAALILGGAALGWKQLQLESADQSNALPVQSSPGVATGGPPSATPPDLLEDRLSQSATWFALGLGLLAAIAAGDGEAPRVGRRYALLLLSLAGVCLAAVVNDLFLAVVAIELASLPATIVLFLEGDASSAKAAAMRSLALNLLALGILLAAACLVRAAFGTTNFEELRTALPEAAAARHARSVAVASSTTGEVCCVLLLSGLGIHFLAAPFQLAAGDIFDGAKFWGVGLTALFSRGAVLLLMIRVLVQGPPRLHGTAQTLLTAVGFLTILVGGLLAIWQVRIRRLLAFFAVFQSGLILLALAAACCERARPIATPWLTWDVLGGVGAACFCFAIDSLALVGFLALVASRRRSDRPIDELQQVAEAVRDNKATAVAACVLLLSLAGVPPLAGYWPRIAILRSILSISFPPEHGFLPHQNVNYALVAMVIGVGLILLTAVSLGFVKKVLLDEVETAHVEVVAERVVPVSTFQKSAAAIGFFAALAIVVLGFFPGPATRMVARSAADEEVIRQTSADRAHHLTPSKPRSRRNRTEDDDDI